MAGSKSTKRAGGRRKKRSSRRPITAAGRRAVGLTFRAFVAIALLSLPTVVVYVVYLDATVRDRFEGRLWALPARAFARPLELYTGKTLTPLDLRNELQGLYYREDSKLASPGSFSRNGSEFSIYTRGFQFADENESPQRVRVAMGANRVGAVSRLSDRSSVDLLRLDPQLIGSIYPGHKEDRILVSVDETPMLLIDALLAVEDRQFYSHFGVAPRAIARALWANLMAGGVVQGGSTLTQQLAKNFYLSPERSLWRKLNEAVMAVLLEWRYDKRQILETYLNEIYLGQDGQRAIHGFGLGSHFYFARPLSHLGLAEVALLVGLVRGPSYYNPRRNPERAKERRNVVLDVLQEQGVVSAAQSDAARRAPLGIVERPPGGRSPYPAFLDLVRRQLNRDYRDEDLTSEGLRIFTTLDPTVQRTADRVIAERAAEFERLKSLPPGKLQGAIVVTARESAEVLAVSGGRESRYAGFNRALDAIRPIGSLVKPVVYLTALSQPQDYSLITLLDDSPLRLRDARGKIWSPDNFDHRSHGHVTLQAALTNSYNLSTVRLGLAVGVESVVETMAALGVRRKLAPYPSLLLGAAALSPLEVAQMYQTLADGGFRTPLRAIRAVLDTRGRPLRRYGLTVKQAVDPAAVYLLTTGLQSVVATGTAKSLRHTLPSRLNVAGKTGTTDEMRDSWFAGFTGNYVAVSWLGMDDNGSTGLTGARGALRVWGELMARIHPQPLEPPIPGNVVWTKIDPQSRLLAGGACSAVVRYPFIVGSAPTRDAPCAGATWSSRADEARTWLWGLFK